MKNFINNKKKMLGLLVFGIIMVVLGVSYAWFNYYQEGTNKKLVMGDIYLTLNEGQEQISLENVFPMTKEEAREEDDNFITFTLSGLNTTNKDIYYEIKLNYGDNETGLTRFNDQDLVFDLVEVGQNNEETYVVDAKSFNSIDDKKIWVDTVNSNTTTEVVKTYKLRVWLSDQVIISDSDPNRTYCATDNCVSGETAFKNHYASVKLSVFGDFKEKELDAVNKLKKLAQVKNDINFGKISSDTNGKGLYKLGNTDILYYRGEVDNNNVIFGGFCWQIVRTTDTGGIKMIYNGVVTGNGKTCENTEANDRQLASTTAFNTNYQSMSDVGYMYNKRYEYSITKPTEGVYYGSGVSYDDTTNTYTLTGADVTTPDASHHYSCDLINAQGSCATVRYYYYVSGSDYYDIKLTDGEKIEDAIYKMTGYGTDEVKNRTINQNYKLNDKDSTIKAYIESWFKTNLTNEEDATKINYQEYLEDTVYCNDRSFQDNGNNTLLKSGWNPNIENTNGNGGLTTIVYFNTRTRWYNSSWYSTEHVPVFTCPKEEDQFTVSNEKGNGKLTYPVGLLTADEIILAGASGNSSTTANELYYLYTGNYYWGLSSSHFDKRYASVFFVSSTGDLNNYSNVNNAYGARPVVSLKSGTEFESGGDGTSTNPYVVKIS